MSKLEKFDNNKLLLEIANVDDEIKSIFNKRDSMKNYLFYAFDSLLIFKYAITDTTIASGINKAPLALQLHIVLNEMAFNKDIPNFVNQYYLPLLQELYEEDFEAANYLIIKSSRNDSILYNTYVCDDRLEKINNKITNYYNRIIGTKELMVVKRYTLPMQAAFDRKQNEIVYGPLSLSNNQIIYGNGWMKIYNPELLLMQEGEFYNGWKVGMWNVYDAVSGTLRKEQKYLNNYPTYQKEYLSNEYYTITNGVSNNEFEQSLYNYYDIQQEKQLVH